MKLSSSMIILGAALGRTVLAAPRPQYVGQPPNVDQECDQQEAWTDMSYEDVEEEQYDGDAELVTGASCTSLKSAGCSITKTYTWLKYVLFLQISTLPLMNRER